MKCLYSLFILYLYYYCLLFICLKVEDIAEDTNTPELHQSYNHYLVELLYLYSYHICYAKVHVAEVGHLEGFIVE